MTERKNAFRAVVDALVQAREAEAGRQVKKYLIARDETRVPFKVL